MDNNKYIQNPDVNLREEDEDGALLYNPDTDQIQVISETGYFIWKLCREEKTIDDIVDAFNREYSDVPENDVRKDVTDFIKVMLETGFIGKINE